MHPRLRFATVFAFLIMARLPASLAQAVPEIVTIAGQGNPGFSGDGGLATAGTLFIPYGVAVDAAGNIYISDNGNNRIRKVAAGTFTITTVAGNGVYGFSGDGGAATSAQLAYPEAIAVDAAGNIYIADASNQRIRKVTASTGIITTVAGSGGAGFSGDGGPATSAALYYPFDVAVDNAGNIYIADLDNQRIRKVTASTGIITTVAGNGGGGHGALGSSLAGYYGDGGPATNAGLAYPLGVAVDTAGNVYIADSGNERIRKVFASNGYIFTVAGNGSSGFAGDGGPATSAEMAFPLGVAADSAGDIYFADSANQRIRTVTASTGIISTIAGDYSVGYSGDGGPATSAELYFPEEIALDKAGNIYIADDGNNVVREVSLAPPQLPHYAATPALSVPPGTYFVSQTVALTDVTAGATIYYTTDGSTPTTSSVEYTGAITVAASKTIKAIATAPGYQPSAEVTGAYSLTAVTSPEIVTVAGNGIPGNTGHQTTAGIDIAGGIAGYAGDGGMATAALLNEPQGVAVDSAGNIYIVDAYNERIRKVSAKTGIITTVAGNGGFGFYGDGRPATSAQFAHLTSAAVDSAGNIYIADTNDARIRKVTASTGIITTVAGNGVYGFSGDGGVATSAELSYAYGVAVDSAGNIYIADTYNARIRKVTEGTGIITTVAGNGILGYTGDQGPATAAELYVPDGVAVDSAGNLYIADTGNKRIRKVSASTGIITTVAGNRTYGYSGDGGAATNAELADPTSVAVDSAGNIYIADNENNRVRKVTASTGVITTVTGNGIVGYMGDQGPATAAEIAYPYGVAADSAGNIYISDTQNNVVREVSTSPHQWGRYTPPPYFSLSAGTYDGVQIVAIADYAPAAAIYYTTNGATPTTSSPLYSGPIDITESATLQAIAVAPGDAASTVAAAAFTIQSAAAQTPTFSLASGVYTGAQMVTIKDATSGAVIYYTTDGTAPTISSTMYTGGIITVSSTETLEAIASATNYSQSALARATYAIMPQTAEPLLIPGTGTYTGPQMIQIMDTTPGATIFYTTDGTNPGKFSTPYTTPIPVSSTTIVKAIAYATGYATSPEGAAKYTIVVAPPAAEPTFSPAGGSFSSAQSVTITDTTPGATIYYTTNGMPPTTSSTMYTGGLITVSSTETLEAIAVATNYAQSAVARVVFTIMPQAAQPILTPGTGTYTGPQMIKITDTTPGAMIFYTTDGINPSRSSMPYTGLIPVNSTTVIKAVVYAAGYFTSPEGAAKYTIVR